MNTELTPGWNVFKQIFDDHWDEFKAKYPKYDNEQYEEPVQKMLECGNESDGYSEHICMNCGRDFRRVTFSCKSYFRLSCLKVRPKGAKFSHKPRILGVTSVLSPFN